MVNFAPRPSSHMPCLFFFTFFFFNDTATTEIYTLSLHDALPISNGLSEVEAVRHETAFYGEAEDLGDRWKSMLQREGHYGLSMSEDEGAAKHEESLHTLISERRKCRVKVVGAANCDDLNLNTQRLCPGLRLADASCIPADLDLVAARIV